MLSAVTGLVSAMAARADAAKLVMRIGDIGDQSPCRAGMWLVAGEQVMVCAGLSGRVAMMSVGMRSGVNTFESPLVEVVVGRGIR